MPDLYSAEILHTGFVTHDVKQFILTRPPELEYEPGQGVHVAVDEEGWVDEDRPFTPTQLRDQDVLEFTIKGYPGHDGVTDKLHSLQAGDELLLSDAFGSITWQGPGTFIAGGAGVTPFLAILRNVQDAEALDGCSLIFSNKTPADVIAEKELRHLLGDRCVLTCTHASGPGYDDRRIDRAYLQEKVEDGGQPFYVCGSQDFVEDITSALGGMGVERDRFVVEE